MAHTIALVISAAQDAERAVTACQLAERLLVRGQRVTVFAHDHAATLAAGAGELPAAVQALLRRGVHGGTLDWVVDATAASRLGVADRLVRGVVPGDHADLWEFVGDADMVLGAGRGQ